jgi:hypothetical protein
MLAVNTGRIQSDEAAGKVVVEPKLGRFGIILWFSAGTGF